MEIKKAEIKYFKKSGFDSDAVEGRKHVKILPTLSIVQSTHGSYDIALGSSATEPTGEGGFFVAPAGVQQTIVHHVNPTTKRMTARWIFIDVEINGFYKLDSLYQFPTVIKDGIRNELNDLFDIIFSSDDLWENYSCCYKILGLLLKTASPTPKKLPNGIQNAATYISENFARQISISELASMANMSESNFYASFKKQFATSPIAYLNNYRLSLAAERLKDTDMSINEICNSVGISDQLYFSKAFKKTYGIPPREYRSTHKKM